jgi:hypothetical protein
MVVSFFGYESGQVPVGHDPPDPAEPAPTLKLLMSFSMRRLPHCLHVCDLLALTGSSTSDTCPQSAQRYS